MHVMRVCSTKGMGMPLSQEPSGVAPRCLMLVLNNNILRPLQLNAMVAHLSIPRAIGYWSVEFKHSAVLEKPMAAPQPHTALC